MELDEKEWDRWLTLAAVMLGPFSIYLVGGLDHHYGWSPHFPAWLQPAALLIMILGYALMLGSLWALIPALLSDSLFVVRTALEDRTLQEELEGYRAYARQTRYRLLPGVW